MLKVNIHSRITDNASLTPVDYIRQVGNVFAIHKASGQSQHHLFAIASNASISLGKPEDNIRHCGEADATEEDKRLG